MSSMKKTLWGQVLKYKKLIIQDLTPQILRYFRLTLIIKVGLWNLRLKQ